MGIDQSSQTDVDKYEKLYNEECREVAELKNEYQKLQAKLKEAQNNVSDAKVMDLCIEVIKDKHNLIKVRFENARSIALWSITIFKALLNATKSIHHFPVDIESAHNRWIAYEDSLAKSLQHAIDQYLALLQQLKDNPSELQDNVDELLEDLLPDDPPSPSAVDVCEDVFREIFQSNSSGMSESSSSLSLDSSLFNHLKPPSPDDESSINIMSLSSQQPPLELQAPAQKSKSVLVVIQKIIDGVKVKFPNYSDSEVLNLINEFKDTRPNGLAGLKRSQVVAEVISLVEDKMTAKSRGTKKIAVSNKFDILNN